MLGTDHNRQVSTATAASRPVVVTAALVASGCVAFAAVNVAFEATDRFADGPHAEYAAGLSVMNWLVVVLKLVGAAIALLTVAPRWPGWLSPRALATLVWAAFATLAVYAVGSGVQAIGLATGQLGDPDELTPLSQLYLAGAVAAALGFGVLAISHTRRSRTGAGPIVTGAVVAPLLLAGILAVAPAILSALGVMPEV